MPSLLCNRKLNTLSLLGNRKLDISMDTLATPVLFRCTATNNRKASVFYRVIRLLYREGNRQISESVSGKRSDQTGDQQHRRVSKYVA
jgi:hypothetical protein